ncbi:MAG: glycosyltransferase family 4 protein [Planctomycetes bacterium]|nr:glycosyltransferase family 4 protein [Planctomycetota bacterium]
MAARPRITFLADRPRWAQARTARAISRYLADDFECRVVFANEEPDLRAWPSDLLHIGSWDSTWHRSFGFERERIVKSVTNHRWAEASLAPDRFVAEWLDDAGTLTCCSERLRRSLAPYCDIHLTPMGFDPFVFPGPSRARGPLRFGWAGVRSDASKGLDEILRPALGDSAELSIAGGGLTLAEMGDFFRSVDVIAVASQHDGAPLTLIEAMASGCYPICTDVGIVPELIADGQNGLVVPGEVEAFREAFEWCRANVETVRQVGRQNAETMRRRRTWEHVADKWREAFWTALDRSSRQDWVPRPAVSKPATARRSDEVRPEPANHARRVALLSPHYDTGRLDDQIVELATRRLLGERHFECGPSDRAPNDSELERLRDCELAVVCGGDLTHQVWDGALAPRALQRLGLPIVTLGVRCSDGASVGAELEEFAGRCRGIGTLDEASRRELAAVGIDRAATVGSPVLFFESDEEHRSGDGVPVIVLHGNRLSGVLDEVCAALDPILLVSDVEDFRTATRLVRRHGSQTIVRGDHLSRHLAAAGRVLSLRAPHGLLALALGSHVVFAGDDPEVGAVRSLLRMEPCEESALVDAIVDPRSDDGRIAEAVAGVELAMGRLLQECGLTSRVPVAATC